MSDVIGPTPRPDPGGADGLCKVTSHGMAWSPWTSDIGHRTVYRPATTNALTGSSGTPLMTAREIQFKPAGTAASAGTRMR